MFCPEERSLWACGKWSDFSSIALLHRPCELNASINIVNDSSPEHLSFPLLHNDIGRPELGEAGGQRARGEVAARRWLPLALAPLEALGGGAAPQLGRGRQERLGSVTARLHHRGNG